jgi:hypothetical protein
MESDYQIPDTFAVAWRRRDRIPDPALPGLYAIAGHVIANHVRTPVTSTLLGQRATTFHYAGQRPNYATILSPQGNVFIEVNGTLGSKQEYEAVLHSLRPVGVEAWLGAMPHREVAENE